MLDLRQYRPIIMVKDKQSGKVFEFGTSSHDRMGFMKSLYQTNKSKV